VNDLLPFVIVGVTLGSVYGLAGIGLVLTYKTSGIFNFGHGALATIAAYTFYELWVTPLGIPWPAALAITMIVLCAVLGFAMERFAARLSRVPLALRVVGTVGLILVVESTYYLIYGPVPNEFPQFLPTETFRLGGVNVGYDQVIIVAVSTVVTAALYLLFRTTQLGRQMRAVVDDSTLVDLTGTSANRVRRWAWVAGVFLVALSGILLAPLVDLDPQVLTLLIVQAFGAAAIGGFSSLPWTWAGGLAIGLASSIATEYINSTSILAGLPPSIPFLILFGAILLRRRDRLYQAFSSANQAMKTDRWRAPFRVQAVGGLVLLTFLLLVPIWDPLHLSEWTVGLTDVVLLLSLGLLVRLSGQVSLCQVSFAAVGAAAFSHVAQAGVPWLIALIIAGLVAVPLGALLAVPAIRLSGLYLALATFGFGLLLQDMFYQSNLMFGPSNIGISMPRPSIAINDRPFYYVVLVLTVVVIAVVGAITATRLGRLLGSMSESESAIAVCGTDVTRLKIAVFCISAFIAAIAGALNGIALGSVSGNSFPPLNSLTFVALVVIAVGGVPWYAIVGIAVAVLPGYFTSYSTGYYLELFFGLSAIMIACGLSTPMPARLRAFVTYLGGSPKGESEVTPVNRVERKRVLRRSEAYNLQVEELTVRFGGVHAVDRLSFTNQAGVITGLIGPNGAGKTTTFNACSGLVPVTHGKVILNGENITSLAMPARAQRGLGRTFQSIDLLDSYSARENVQLAAEAELSGRGMSRMLVGRHGDEAEICARAGDALETCGLLEVAEMRASTLSNRQRRLLSVARCLAAGFRIVMLDEPSAGLDARETVEFGDLLTSIAKQRGIGIVVVEHDMSLVMKVCDEIYVLDFGKLVMHGTPSEVQAHPAVRAAYLGEEPVSGTPTASSNR